MRAARRSRHGARLDTGTVSAKEEIMKTSYSVCIDGQRGTEEYPGGSTIAEARKEAAFFVANTPAHVGVRIHKVVGVDCRLSLVEVAR